MCGFTGWIDWTRDLTLHSEDLEVMTRTLALRGPDASGTWISGPCALGHRRLSVMDPENGAQPMIRNQGEDKFVIVYNGELYNAPELKRELESRGRVFTTTCDTEVLLASYMEWGAAAVEKFNGIFAFAIWDTKEERLFLARDRVGVKPLFISHAEGQFIFGSEPKALLAHPAVKPEVGAQGIAELFIVGPARTPGVGVYSALTELLPGKCMTVDRSGTRVHTYWQLRSEEHSDSVEETAARVGELLQDTLERQLASDVPIGTLLSGGLDSSALTALAVNFYNRSGGGRLHTFSVDYVDNDKHFKSHAFQPNSDAPWIQRMRDFLDTDHHDIQFDTPELADALDDALTARDLPGMADVDASLLLFCREIKKGVTVAISGEAADEVFGGYPWFHREESLNADTFPWALASGMRAELALSRDARVDASAGVHRRPLQRRGGGGSASEGRDGEAAQDAHDVLLEHHPLHADAAGPQGPDEHGAGLEVRVPFCDHRLIQYVFNIPWEIKTAGDREKGILRESLRGVLPDDVLFRKKSPYPKTHNPAYLNTVRAKLMEVLNDSARRFCRSSMRPR